MPSTFQLDILKFHCLPLVFTEVFEKFRDSKSVRDLFLGGAFLFVSSVAEIYLHLKLTYVYERYTFLYKNMSNTLVINNLHSFN